MPNKKVSTVAACLKTYIKYVKVFDIMQCNNKKEFKGATLILLKNYRVKVINKRFQTPCTQRLVKQANKVMKNKIKKKIKAIRNF